VHETGLAVEIHRVARAVADEHGGGALESVTVAVGDLAAVEPPLLEFAWNAVVDGTADAAAELIVEWERARQDCALCGEVPDRAPGSWLRLCPRCDEPLRVTGGDALDVLRVVFAGETEEAAEGAA
jgi:Zn finger protein HypA/HybF involved in hydrogenase expression